MKEYAVGVPTNAWNAIRYTVVTLALVPLAEMLLALLHSKRTGDRLMRGHKARLRQSKLAHWGLHQEVDEKSRLSKISAVVVCLLHICGALLLEYGSGSKGAYILHDVMLSQSLRDDGDVRANTVYFIDTGYIYGKPFGSTDCIDGEPRNLSDFGLRMTEKPPFRFVSKSNIPRPRLRDVKAEYLVLNSGLNFQMFDNGSARWYAANDEDKWDAYPEMVLGFVNQTLACRRHNSSSYVCAEYKKNMDEPNLLSKVLAEAVVKGTISTSLLWRQKQWELSVILSRVSISTNIVGRRAEARAQSGWVRNGMPRGQIPRKTGLTLELKTKPLKDGCNHKHAVHPSNNDKIRGLKVLNASLPYAEQVWNPDKEDHKLVVWTDGKYAAVGTLMNALNEYCSSYNNFRLCVRSVHSAKHEVAFYVWKYFRSNLLVYTKVFNLSVEGKLRKEDALNLAIQANVETYRRNQIMNEFLDEGMRERVGNLIENGKMFSGLVRVTGKRVRGKAVLRWSDSATINILVVAGVGTLILLVAMPLALLCYYAHGIAVHVENSYWRAVMDIQGVQDVPERAPSIIAKELGEGHLWSISHTLEGN